MLSSLCEAGKDHCSYVIPLEASKQLRYLLPVLASSEKTGERMCSTIAVEILLNKAGDKEDCLQDDVRGTVFIFLYISCLVLPKTSYQSVFYFLFNF